MSFIKRIIVFGLVFGLFFTAGVMIPDLLQRVGSNSDNKSGKTEQQKHQDGERTNILLLGIDARPGENRTTCFPRHRTSCIQHP